MNWKFWSLITLGFGSLMYGFISSAADKHLEESVDDMAVEMRDDETREDIRWAENNLKEADAITARERKEICDGIRKWKQSSDYESRIRDLHSNTVDGIREFKESINYDARRQDIDDEYEDSLDSFKDSIDYDYEIELANAEIQDAENVYKKHSRRIDLAGGGDDDISDALKDVKKAEKDKMNEAIKEAKGKISALKNKVSAEETRLGRKKQAAIRELDLEVQPTKLRLQKEEQAACKLLEDEKAKVEAEIRAEVIGRRTEEEQKILDWVDESKTIMEAQTRKEHELARKLYEDASESQKWAGYFKDNGVSRFTVGAVGALPLIPVGYLVWKYVKFVSDVIRAM